NGGLQSFRLAGGSVLREMGHNCCKSSTPPPHALRESGSSTPQAQLSSRSSYPRGPERYLAHTDATHPSIPAGYQMSGRINLGYAASSQGLYPEPTQKTSIPDPAFPGAAP